MANINESIEQLTASLQELTAQTYNHAQITDAIEGKVAMDELQLSREVEAFVNATSAYSEKTREISVGTY
jgi:hypothetical protein